MLISGPEGMRLRSALWDRTTGLASFHMHLDEIRARLEEHGVLALLHVTSGELTLLEALYGWQVVDGLMQKAAGIVRALGGGVISDRAITAVNGVCGEEILIFEPGPAASTPVDATAAAGAASAVGRALEEGFAANEFASMSPRLSFRVGYALIEDNPHFRFERVLYRAIEQARSLPARREKRRREERELELRRILSDRQVTTLYQPVLRLDTLEVVGYEVFSGGAEGGPLDSPGLLFALSDQLGLSRELDRLCREAALRSLRPLGGGARLFLNARPESLADPEWSGETLALAMGRLGLSPTEIIIEVSERALADMDVLAGAVADLRARGFGIALDDVGTWHSSALAIQAARPDYLKIDMSLVRGADRNRVKQEVIRSIAGIAQRTGAKVVAEGIETRAELEAVRACGAQWGQGYLFARPAREIPRGPFVLRGATP